MSEINRIRIYKIKKIINIVTKELCSGCGFCVAVCPRNALVLVKRKGFYRPQFNESKCMGCGLCLEICPMMSIQGKVKVSEHRDIYKYNPLVGYYIDCFLCYASDISTRLNASSGGCVTALLKYMLDKRLADEVIVVSNEYNPVYSCAISTSDINIVVKATGSKYTQIDFTNAVKRIIKFKEKKFAFVGLPCHIRALRNLESELKLNNIVLKIGLYCNNLPSALASEYLLYLYGVLVQHVEELRYRGLGWPGYMVIKLKSGKKLYIPFDQYWSSGFGHYFYDKVCFLCSDHTAELSDLSVGDPWNALTAISDPGRKLGYSLVIARSRKGFDLLTSAEREGYLKLRRIPIKYAIQTQTVEKKIAKNDMLVLKLLRIPIEVRFDYVYQSKLVIFKAINYIIGRSFAMKRKLWLILIVWTRLVELLHSLTKFVNKVRG